MPGGYTGKILRVNLTTKEISRIDTAKYEDFGGGHGIGSAAEEPDYNAVVRIERV